MKLITDYIARFKGHTFKDILIRIILIFTVVGSITGYENSQAFGCVYGLEMLTISNLLFAAFSIFVFVKVKNSNNQKFIRKLLLFELLFWIVKLLFYKGGYITGYAGVPNTYNVSYDFIAIALRIFLLIYLHNFKRLAIPTAILLAFVCSTVKINFFPLPAYTKYKWHIYEEKFKNQRIQTAGDYEGQLYHFADSLSLLVNIKIDSTQMRFNNNIFKELDTLYEFHIEDRFRGILRAENQESYEIQIKKMEDDSLVLVLKDMYELESKFKLSLSKVE